VLNGKFEDHEVVNAAPMKRSLLVFLSILFGVVSSHEAAGEIISAFDRPLEERLGGQTEWQMNNRETLKISQNVTATLLSGPSGIVIEIPRPEHVQQVVPSSSLSCLLLLVFAERPGGGSDYSRLIRISRNQSDQWVAQTLFTKHNPPMNSLHRSIVELGAISESGRMALFKMAEANQEPTPYRMKHSWQTWVLDKSEKVSDGIRVPADFDK
jgi:hypothetical protein